MSVEIKQNVIFKPANNEDHCIFRYNWIFNMYCFMRTFFYYLFLEECPQILLHTLLIGLPTFPLIK